MQSAGSTGYGLSAYVQSRCVNHCRYTYVEQVSNDSKGPQAREILQVYEIADKYNVYSQSEQLAPTYSRERHFAMPCAERRAPSTLECSKANVLQFSRRCGTEYLRIERCEFALEIAVGIRYHAVWQT